MKSLLLAAALSAALLAGCAGSGHDGHDTDPAGPLGTGGEHGEHDAATHLLAPTWVVGQSWTYASPQLEAPYTHVVSADAGADWILDTDSPNVAFFDALSDISYLGKVRKSDLAGSQGADRIEFFRFPLTQGKGWTTTWDGQVIALNVTKVDAGKATIDGRREDGTLYTRYTYDGAIGSFRDYTFYGADGATEGFAASLTASGKSFGGDLVRYALTPLFEHHGSFEPKVQNFDVGPGFTDIHIAVAVNCTTGVVAVNVGALTGPVENRGFSANGPCPVGLIDAYPITAPAMSEVWGAAILGGPIAQGTLDVTVLGRVLTAFKAGSAP